jgi:HEAT repeat protein/TolA-binding protein
MKRIIATMMLVATVGAVRAQEPPTPPARPAPAPRPAVTPTPPATPAPRIYSPYAPLPAQIDIDDIRINSEEIARMARDASRDALRNLEFAIPRIDVDAIRAQSAQMAEQAREASREFSRVAVEESREWAERAREDARRATEDMRNSGWITPMPAIAPMAPMPAFPAFTPMPAIAPFGRAGDGFRVVPPQYFQGDPADSVYRLAQDLLFVRGDYGRAAQLFRDIGQKYPKSSYIGDLPYYEAFARYKIGTTDELQNAAKLLEPRASKLIGTTTASSSTPDGRYFPRGRGPGEGDVVGLYIRVNSALAQRGNRAAADIVSRAAQAGTNTCDAEDMQTRVEAMNALSQMDPNSAFPIIKNVLNKKDECSAELRRRAIFMLGRRGDAEAATLLAATAKSDPSTSVRSEAISWLPKLQGDAGVNMLEELLRTDTDERIQRAVIRTLNSTDNQRARSAMRGLIDRKDAAMNLRLEAINSFSNDRTTTEDAAYLRGLYNKVENDRLKDAIINAVARIGGQENDQWVLNLAKNQSEPSSLRATAISRLMRSNMPVSDLIKLYDASESYDIRSRIVSALENRKEPEASEKLVDIVRNSTVMNIRSQALQALMRKKDPRSEKMIQDILDGKKP